MIVLGGFDDAALRPPPQVKAVSCVLKFVNCGPGNRIRGKQAVDVADVDRLVLEVGICVPAHFTVFIQLEVEALVVLVVASRDPSPRDGEVFAASESVAGRTSCRAVT
jgi:hypothetical protein